MIRLGSNGRFVASAFLCFGAACAEAPPTTGPSSESPTELQFTAIVAGDDHTCAINPSGGAFCWGGNEVGQLGHGSFALYDGHPRQVVDGHIFTQITAGAFHTCGISIEQITYCWGFNVTGQLGHGRFRGRSSVPVRVDTDNTFVEVSAGGGHTCALLQQGDVYCWGARSDGSAADDSTVISAFPVRVEGVHTFTTVVTGGDHRCGLTVDRLAFCWGAGTDGQLGTGDLLGSVEPRPVQGNHEFVSLGVGDAHSCGLTTEGVTYCWGLNSNGQLGGSTEPNELLPVEVRGPAFSSISVGGDHSCGLTEDAFAHCWGLNGFGQLGNGTRSNGFEPTPVEGGIKFATVAAGRFHTCGISLDGVSYCWGFNQRSQLGDGTTTERLTPVLVSTVMTLDP